MPKLLLFAVLLALHFTQPAYGAENLQVIQVTPQGMVNNLSQITVRFSQDMRPLGAMEQDEASVKLVPSLAGAQLPAGNWRWLDPSTLAYLFNTPLQGSVEFTVKVPKGMRALNGASLDKEASFKITMPLIELNILHANLGPQATVILEANQPLDVDSLAAKTKILVNNRQVGYDLQPATERNQAPSRYTFALHGKLPPNAKVQIKVDKGLKPAQGFIVSPQAFIFNENGYSSLKLQSWQVGSSRNNQAIEADSPLLLFFNNPVNYSDLLEHISVSPEVGLERAPVQFSDSSSHALRYQWRPRTSYNVTIKPGLSDSYGTTMDKAVDFTVKIGDYPPVITINNGARVAEASLGAIFPIITRNISPVEIRAKLLEWSAIVQQPSTSFTELPPDKLLEFPPNTVNNYQLNLNELLGQDTLGRLIALAVRYKLPGDNDNINQYTQLQVTNLGISFKMAENKGLAWVTTLDTAQPVAKAALAIYDHSGKQLWSGHTNENGLCELPGMSELPPASQWPVLMASSGRDQACVPLLWSHAFGYYSTGMQWPQRADMHVISQLPIYQPGQEVNLLAYVRTSTAQGWRALGNNKAQMLLRDSQGKTLIDREIKLNEYGSVDLNFTLNDDAPLGDYYLYINSLENEALKSNAQAFRVAAFRTPDFKIDLQAPSAQPLPTNPAGLESRVAAAYFFGAPMANAQGEMVARQHEQHFAPQKLNGYRVGIGNYRGYDSKELGRMPISLDNQGRASITLPEPQVVPGQTVLVNLEALISDPSGLSTQGAASFMIYPSSYFVGLKSPYVGKAGQPVKIELKTSTFDNQPLINVPVNLRVRRLHMEREPIVLQKEININNANGVEAEFTLTDSGTYEISVLIKDQQGRENITTATLFVTGSDMIWPAPFDNNTTLELVADKDSYQPGDTARVMIKNPFNGPALITLERAGIVRYWLHDMNEPIVEVPLDSSTYITVQLVKGRSAPPPDKGADTGRPMTAMGTLLLNVAEKPNQLSVSLRTEREQYRPGQQVNVWVQTSRQCQLTLLAVDKRVLRVAGGQTGYLPVFTPVQWRGVLTADIRTRLQDLSVMDTQAELYTTLWAPAPGAPGRPMRANSEMAMDRAQDSQGEELRQNFAPNAYWLASVQTNGYHHSVFQLPDSLTAYAIVAIAADRDESFAMAEREITVSQPLQITSSLPTFATQGDELTAQFLAHNLSNSSGSISVELQASGVEIADAARQQLQVAAGQSAAFNYRIKVGQPGQVELLLRASMGAEKDSVNFVLPVLPALPLLNVAAAGMLDTGRQYTLPVELPSDVDSRSRLQISLAPSPAAGLSLTAQAIMDYPWDCLEQRMSKAAVRITRLAHGELLSLQALPDDREKAQAVFDTIGKFQNSDGGFNLWSGLPSNLYLTAYVMLVASQAGQVDVTLEEQVRQRALSYLDQQMRQQPDEDLDTQAMAAWVLAVNGHDTAAGYLASLTKQAAQMNPMGLAALMLGHQASSLPQPASLITTLEKQAAITATELHFNTPAAYRCWYSMGSGLRDNALALMALAQVKPDYPRLHALALWLCRGLGEKARLSTQEAIYGIWGIGAYLKSLGGNQEVAVRAVWNQSREITANFSRLVEEAQNWQLEEFKPGANTLTLQALAGQPYWAARLSYASQSNQQAINAGFSIERRWLTPGPWKMGQIVDVELTIIVPQWRRHVLLYDPFPAGLEPLYATRADLARQNQRYQAPWMWQDMRGDGLLLFSYGVAPGTYTYNYQLRAFAPGKFIQRASYVEEMYTPEVFGRTTPSQVEVLAE